MDIIDFSATNTRKPVKHVAALPNSVRMIIIGPSGSGKTQLLLNLIMRWMKWDKLYLIAPSVDDQRCYEVLKDFNENASEIAGEGIINFITDIDEAQSVEDQDGNINNLVVYDDVMLVKQKNPARIFSRGRHKNTDVIYVTPGKEFHGAVASLMKQHNVTIRRGHTALRRDQAIVERFNRTLAERLFGYQYAK